MQARSVVAAALAAFTLAMLQPDAGRAADVFEQTFTAIEGGPMPLETYRGHPMLVVNTASLCGYTYQYKGLQVLWERYRDRGLIVLGVPSNDFGRQEPGSSDEIKTFCEVNFAIDFPMTEKVQVKGPGSHPLFALFRQTLGESVGPSWNFTKFLVDSTGHPVAAWPSGTEPSDPAILSAIEALLAKGA